VKNALFIMAPITDLVPATASLAAPTIGTRATSLATQPRQSTALDVDDNPYSTKDLKHFLRRNEKLLISASPSSSISGLSDKAIASKITELDKLIAYQHDITESQEAPWLSWRTFRTLGAIPRKGSAEDNLRVANLKIATDLRTKLRDELKTRKDKTIASAKPETEHTVDQTTHTDDRAVATGDTNTGITDQAPKTGYPDTTLTSTTQEAPSVPTVPTVRATPTLESLVISLTTAIPPEDQKALIAAFTSIPPANSQMTILCLLHLRDQYPDPTSTQALSLGTLKDEGGRHQYFAGFRRQKDGIYAMATEPAMVLHRAVLAENLPLIISHEAVHCVTTAGQSSERLDPGLCPPKLFDFPNSPPTQGAEFTTSSSIEHHPHCQKLVEGLMYRVAQAAEAPRYLQTYRAFSGNVQRMLHSSDTRASKDLAVVGRAITRNYDASIRSIVHMRPETKGKMDTLKRQLPKSGGKSKQDALTSQLGHIYLDEASRSLLYDIERQSSRQLYEVAGYLLGNFPRDVLKAMSPQHFDTWMELEQTLIQMAVDRLLPDSRKDYYAMLSLLEEPHTTLKQTRHTTPLIADKARQEL
jgi:hypothetical protein